MISKESECRFRQITAAFTSHTSLPRAEMVPAVPGNIHTCMTYDKYVRPNQIHIQFSSLAYVDLCWLFFHCWPPYLNIKHAIYVSASCFHISKGHTLWIHPVEAQSSSFLVLFFYPLCNFYSKYNLCRNCLCNWQKYTWTLKAKSWVCICGSNRWWCVCSGGLVRKWQQRSSKEKETKIEGEKYHKQLYSNLNVLSFCC